VNLKELAYKLVSSPLYALLIIAIVSTCFHIHIFRLDPIGIHVWRQTQTLSNIRNFYKEDINILHPRIDDRQDGDGILRIEFPIMAWSFALFYFLFGENMLLVRILSFAIGLMSLLGIYHLAKSIFSNYKMAFITSWCLAFSPLFFYYTLNPLPDNLALCLSVWGIVYYFRWRASNNPVPKLPGKKTVLILSGLFFALGILSKLPFIIFTLPVLTLIIIDIYRKQIKLEYIFFIYAMVIILPPLCWYGWVIPMWGGEGIAGIHIAGFPKTSELIDIFIHNFVSTLPELIVNYGSLLFFVFGFYYLVKNKAYKKRFFVPLALWGTGLLAYFIADIKVIAKVHDYYLLPFLPPIFLIVAYGAVQLLASPQKLVRYIATIALLILPITALLRISSRVDIENPGFNKDILIHKDDLQAAVPDSNLCVVGNDRSHAIYFYYLNKKGWAFDNNQLNYETLKEMMDRGAKYLYSDSRIVDENHQLQSLLDSLILERGSVRIYKLRIAGG